MERLAGVRKDISILTGSIDCKTSLDRKCQLKTAFNILQFDSCITQYRSLEESNQNGWKSLSEIMKNLKKIKKAKFDGHCKPEFYTFEFH